MPSNHPLPDILVSGPSRGSDYRVLTPRTPHSRAGRAEEGFTEVELHAFQDDEANDYRSQLQQQSQPLLSRGYRSRGDEHDVAKEAKARSVKHWLSLGNLPLIGGSALALVLLILIAVSYTDPARLEGALLDISVKLAPDTTPSIAKAASSVSSRLPHSLPQTPTRTASASAHPQKSSQSPITSLYDDGHPVEHGSTRLFIKYQNYTQFPLTGDQYRDECSNMMKFMHHGDFWDVPPHGPLDIEHHEDEIEGPEGGITKVCLNTITYMLDGHVGLLADLALLAQTAALARERNATLLIDDTYWNRGKWTDYFEDVRTLQLGPEPGCHPPPPDELVACPRVVRHWVISSRTAMFHMGHAFGEEYEEGHGHHLNRLKGIFERALISFGYTIRPNMRMDGLIRAAREELASILSVPSLPSRSTTQDKAPSLDGRDSGPDESPKNLALYIGVHIRRGDRDPFSQPYYPDGKIPVNKFVNGARKTWDKFYGNTSTPETVVAGTDYSDIGDAVVARDISLHPDGYPVPPILWLASDSPPVAGEFVANFSTATAIFSLTHSTKPELKALAPAHEYIQTEFNKEPVEERARSTKGMIVDFAMLSGLWASPGDIVPGAVVCGMGSNVCKMAALGFGFERAFGFDDDGDYYMGDPNPERARWVDVDNAGRIVPAWKAFELH